MKKITAAVVAILISTIAFAQFGDSNVNLKTTGLSEEYSQKFLAQKNELIRALNQLRVTAPSKPLNVEVLFKDGQGEVVVEYLYEHENLFGEGYSTYKSHNSQWSRMSTGISVLLQDQIFTALSEYKMAVARNGFTIDKDITNFESTVRLLKPNGDQAVFYAKNYFDYRGFYPVKWYTNCIITVDNKKHEVKCSNTRLLNEMKFFAIGKTESLSGEKSGSYYFAQFFKIE